MTSRSDRQMRLRLAVTGGALMALATAMLGPVARAQVPAEPARVQREQELEAVRLEQRQAAETEALLADLGELARVRKEMATERIGLGRDLASLSEEKSRMILLIQERQKRQAETERALDSERQRAIQLARQADNLKDLIARMERE